jgi:hypothetical protein
MAAPAPNPEIQLGFGDRPQGNAAALFGPNIFVIGSDQHSNIQQSIYPAATGFTSESLGNKESWSNSQLKLPDSFSPQTKGMCALAIQSAATPALYLFWSQPNAGAMGTSVAVVTQPLGGGSSTAPTADWSAGLLLCDENKSVLPALDGACVSAVSLGSQAFLVAFPVEQDNEPSIGVVALYYVSDQLPNTTVTTKAGAFGIWPARAVLGLSALSLGELFLVPGLTGIGFGNMISLGVMPQVNGTSSDGNNPLLLNLVMLLTLTVQEQSGKKQLLTAVTCALDDTGAPEGALSIA